MKNKRFAAAVMALAIAVAGIGFSGCGNQTADITGSWWSDDGGTTVIFNKDGTYSIDIETKEYTGNGSYSLKNNTITMIDQKNGSQTYTIEKKNGKVELDGKSNNFYGSHDDAVSMQTIKVAQASSAAQVQAAQKLDKMATAIKDKIIGSWLNATDNQTYTFNKDGTYRYNNSTGKYSIQKYKNVSDYHEFSSEGYVGCIITLDNQKKEIKMIAESDSSTTYNEFTIDGSSFFRTKSNNLNFLQLPKTVQEGTWTKSTVTPTFAGTSSYIFVNKSEATANYKITADNKMTITEEYGDVYTGKSTKYTATFNLYIQQSLKGTYIMNLESDNSPNQDKSIVQKYTGTYNSES